MSRVPIAASIALLAATVSAQGVVQTDFSAPDLDTLPRLPALAADSPRDTLLYADRFAVTPPAAEAAALSQGAVLVDHTISQKITGTGFAEPIQYQLPSDYGQPPTDRPLLVAYHGFGASDGSVSLQSTLDEHCDARGWLYLSVTGVDDQLFGSEICQRHVEVAIQWMSDMFRVDEDRIYMVGFSMGAGIVSSFASRHRDTDGLMVAGVGLVSGSFDWVLTYHGDPGLQPWLEHPLNFTGPPSSQELLYRRAGGLAYVPGSYPPYPGTHDDTLALAAVNLADIPTYVTWDDGDVLTELPSQSQTLVDALTSRSGTVTSVPVSGTVDGAGIPATHSWAVLDEADLFDFLDGRVADRSPDALWALVDEERPVAWLDAVPADGAFAYVRAEVDAAGDVVTLSDVSGARRVFVDAAAAGVDFPARLVAADAGGSTWHALLRGEVARVDDTATGLPITAPEYHGSGDGTGAPVAPTGSVDVTLQPGSWGAQLAVTPDPTVPGGAIELVLETDPDDPAALLIVALADDLSTLPNGTQLNASLLPPSSKLPLPLDGSGVVTLPGTMPGGEPSVSGFRFVMQVLVIDADGPGVISTNPVALDVD